MIGLGIEIFVHMWGLLVHSEFVHFDIKHGERVLPLQRDTHPAVLLIIVQNQNSRSMDN